MILAILLVILVLMLGSATKLQTARNIALTGDVTGSTNFDGSGNVTITTDLTNVAVLTGIATNGDAEIDYPVGFNASNCVVISHMLQRSGSANGYYAGSTLETSNGTTGALPNYVTLASSKIYLHIRQIFITSNSQIIAGDVNYDIYYKIVLMKI